MDYPAGAAADSTILESGSFPVNGRPECKLTACAGQVFARAVLLRVPAVALAGLLLAAT
jgi:hypothetical protein